MTLIDWKGFATTYGGFRQVGADFYTVPPGSPASVPHFGVGGLVSPLKVEEAKDNLVQWQNSSGVVIAGVRLAAPLFVPWLPKEEA